MCEGDSRDAATQMDKVGRVSMIVWYGVAVNIIELKRKEEESDIRCYQISIYKNITL